MAFLDDVVLGKEQYNDDNFQSETLLMENKLIGSDELTSVMTYLNDFIRDESPFMWLNAGQKGYMTSYTENGVTIPLGGDGSYTWPVMGEVKMHSRIVSHNYSATDRVGSNRQTFDLVMEDGWLKAGWLCTFQDQTVARVYGAPERDGAHWNYKFELISGELGAFIDPTNLIPGKLVREGSYVVAGQLSIGTQSNSQTPMKRTNQISFIRNSDRITGNIANMEIKTFKIPTGDNTSTTFWMPYHYWVWRKKDEINTERFLFKTTEYNKDENGVIHLIDQNAGNKPIPLGASIQQMITAQGNDSTYGLDFTLDYFKATVQSVFYGVPAGRSIALTGYAGEEYMNDFGRAMDTDAFNKGYQIAMGEARILGTGESGITYHDQNIAQYITPKGHRFTLVHMPWLDDAGVSEQVVHPRTSHPISSHSCYYIAQGMTEQGDMNVQIMTQKGRAFMQGIFQGMTPIPPAWGAKGDTTMMQLATERDEASIHTFRSVGANIRDTKYTFWHHAERAA